jgi:hypothetical protein
MHVKYDVMKYNNLLIGFFLTIHLSTIAQKSIHVTKVKIVTIPWNLFTRIRVNEKTIYNISPKFERIINSKLFAKRIDKELSKLKPTDNKYAGDLRMLVTVFYNNKSQKNIYIYKSKAIFFNEKYFEDGSDLISIFKPYLPSDFKQHLP